MEKKRIKWNLENWDITKLKVYDKNPRIISKEGLKQLQNSFDEIGNAQPINVNLDGTILSGHARYMQLHQEGQKTVPVYIPDRELTPKQEEAVIIRMNKNIAGEWDFDILSDEWERDDLINWGFTEEELPETDIEKLEPQGDEDAVPELKEEPVTRKGDVWLMGRHRLMCGDSTMIDDVEKLMNGEKADMVYTDPPYGIKYSGRGQKGVADANDFGMIINDDDISVAKDAYRLCKSMSVKNMVFWGANNYPGCLPDLKSWFVWNKETVGENYSDCELAFTTSEGRIKMFTHQWHGMIKASEQGQRRVHPTQKPIALACWAFDQFKDDNELTLDLFLGSGTTLIACEKTNRKCYGMELDEHYCDVIIKRYMDYTGRDDVTLESTGQKYDELKTTRL